MFVYLVNNRYIKTCVSPQAAQAGQTIVATQPAAVTPVISATSVQKTVAGAAPLITNVTAATVAQAARIQVSQVFIFHQKYLITQ